MSLSYPNKIHLAQTPTPLVHLERLSRYLGGPRIWIKRDDLTGAVLTGNKVRKLEFVVADALSQDAEVLITCGGIQSNHCRATAAVAAQLGLKAHLVLRGQAPASAPDGNVLLDHLFGATITYCSLSDYVTYQSSHFEAINAFYAQKGMKAYVIPTGASDEVGIWGYVNCAKEMAEQCHRLGLQPSAILCATGSGGTQAGLTAGVNEYFPEAVRVIGMAVCDDRAYFQNKTQSDLLKWKHRYGVKVDINSLSIETNDEFIGPGYAKAYPDMLETLRMVAKMEGVVLDPVYTGKAMHGLIKLIEQGEWTAGQDIIFVHTGGIYGLFPFREQL
ncbi:D-cysteine desulfhydrase family protein [Marinibactrum halimedae]|uniref:1-aminocyclopropane-1-carboxylate deaminase n=1 Tax=Marinibactrum halimedae TaxID=1444977 RepID=A0AA37T454_9GAMM|nr:D-cysteine desulfhydrase family protein [Marinibactrum halimedae]MCD9460089.1 D-cysteine desulfhydrase family protein [Marinibactrum halimedae]GLS26490.1 1-aminocyclopropane-1-carboxylate deaminase [Marinibactrum halimedae]